MTESELHSINERFNEQLRKQKRLQTNGMQAKGTVYHLGEASEILQSAGIPKLPIEMASRRLLDKSMQDNHPFDLLELIGLPKAIQDPIAVFNSSTVPGAFVVMTEIQHNKKNFVIALHVIKKKNNVDINDIRSVYPRRANQIQSALDNDMATYINPSKLKKWHVQRQFNSGEVNEPLLTAKIQKNIEIAKQKVKNFQNPTKISSKENNLTTHIMETQQKTSNGKTIVPCEKFSKMTASEICIVMRKSRSYEIVRNGADNTRIALKTNMKPAETLPQEKTVAQENNLVIAGIKLDKKQENLLYSGKNVKVGEAQYKDKPCVVFAKIKEVDGEKKIAVSYHGKKVKVKVDVPKAKVAPKSQPRKGRKM